MIQETNSLQTIKDLIRWGASRFNQEGLFFGHGTDNALDEAAYLALHALHLPPDLPAPYLDSRVTPGERRTVLDLFQRRIEERRPAAYLTGEAWFAGLPFHVTPDVLIPRSPMAELIEQGLDPWLETESVGHLLDLCTGSGCIGIVAALHLPGARVDLADISEAALAVARRNVERHGLETRAALYHSDLFDSLPARRYDVILSNPPYVGAGELAGLPAEYRHEPELGLAAGDDGLEVVTRILARAGQYLQPWGIIIVEVGATAPLLTERFPQVPFLWLEFEHGGEGVFLLSAEQLRTHAEAFLEAAST